MPFSTHRSGRAASSPPRAAALVALVIALTAATLQLACDPPPVTPLSLPAGLPLSSLPAEQRALLRVTLEISEASLAETDVVLDTDDFTLSGSFELQNDNELPADGEPRVATLRVYGRFDAEAEEVLLGRAVDDIVVSKGQTTGLDFAGSTFESCEAGIDGSCSLLFDRNRNGVTNMLDLAPTTFTGDDGAVGRGIDPAPQAIFIDSSPETLQFSSGIRLGQFARQVIVLENIGPHPITFDQLDLSGGQGVAISLFDPFGGPVDRPRRSIPAEEINTIVDPGDEFLVAVSFAPVNAFLTTAGVQVVARDTVTDVTQSTRVKIIANADGTLRPRPQDYEEPDIGSSLQTGNGSIPVSAFPAEELFSGEETSSGLLFTGARLTRELEDGSVFDMPADRGFVIDVPPETRLSVSLSGLESDVDLAIVKLDDDNAIASILASSRHSSNGSEGVDVVGDADGDRVVVILGRVELAVTLPAVPGGLFALDEPVPFVLACELSRGPEFSDDDAIVPGAGPLEGGTPFSLRGKGFQPGAIVSFADFRALDVIITVDPVTGESVVTGLMPPGSLEVGKNPATAVVANPSIEDGGDGQAATLPEAFLYDPPAARVEVVLPDVAPTAGAADPITILGNFFTNKDGPPRVNFGDLSVDATFIDERTLEALPAGQPAGTVVLTVQNQISAGVYGSRSNGVAFRFADPQGPPPSIGSVTNEDGSAPATGPADGGDTVNVVGANFLDGARVLFGSVDAQIVGLDPDSITVVTPAVDFDGPIDVSVINPDGQSARATGAFTYFFPAPRIDALLPTRVPTTGGTLIIVTGQSIRNGVVANFRQGASLIPPLSTARTASTTVLVTTPPLALGDVTLVLENPDGQVAESAPLEVFEPQGVGPTIVFIEPDSGPLEGRNLVTVAGRDFDPDGVRVILAGVTFDLPVDVAGAAGFDRVVFEAPPALTPGTQPLVLENGDGQSTVSSYLYVEIDTPRIDRVLPDDLHILPGTELQILGEFFSTLGSELQIFLGAGADIQLLPLVARSDGLLVGLVGTRLAQTGLTPVTITDGALTVSAGVNIVEPAIFAADERSDEIEVSGEHLFGTRLHTFCADGDGYRPSIADDDALLVRRDSGRDVRCPPSSGADPRPIVLVYDNGAQTFAPAGAFVNEEADADGDGVGARDDPDEANPCSPNIGAGTCDFDGDGLVNSADSAGQDPCTPSTNAAPCARDTDGDGVRDPLDGADGDACIPNDQALTCAADADGDGVINPFDPADGDVCSPNPASGACSADSDVDGVTDAFDPVDDNPCIPSATALTCDADGDGIFPPADASNEDPCVPDDQDPLCTDDDDGDGTLNAADANDADPCVPNDEALACGADDDGDGVVNPFDAADADPCAPNPGSAACTVDGDVDGVTDPFDPVDDNPCVPDSNALTCDADGDGVFPPADAANEDPCAPSNQHPLCTDDDDRDGTLNAADADDADACVPDSEALTCTDDDDGDGVTNPFDPADADECTPNPASPACSADSDGDGVTDAFDPVDDNECIPDATAANCDADGDGEFPATDPANEDPCVPDDQDALCTDDDDRDGTLNAADADDADPCVPDSEALACAADADGDGVVNPFDAADADPCAPNPASGACSADDDGDGTTNPFDPVDANPCVPNTTATNCDADGDGVFPPADASNEDPCVPDDQDALCTDDDDRDGTLNAADADDADPCVPDSEALTCGADADGDGVVNPFDAADADPCAPNPASAACSADDDGDGVTNPFDPVDDNECVPDSEALNCDADGDGVLPPADPDNEDPCVPDANDAACTDDDDRDGVLNPADANDADPCVPNSEALTCGADADGDGVINPFDGADADPCAPNPASAACTADADADGTTDPFDPVDDDACVPSTTATNCDADSDGVLPPADADNTDACVPDANDAFCTDDADNDGVLNPADPADGDACVPNSNALACGNDDDADGVANPFDSSDADGCVPNAASAACVVCGDGLRRGAEQCDDGNTSDGDGCSAGCAIEAGSTCSGQPSQCSGVCGDGIAVAGEECDDGDLDSGDGCNSVCQAEVCGDGVHHLALGEECDDFDNVGGDGCDAGCNVEPGFECVGSPSVCTPSGGGATILPNVPGLDPAQYSIVYELAIPTTGNQWNNVPVPYSTDNSAVFSDPFTRVGYYLELQQGAGPLEFVYVEFDALTPSYAQIGVPNLQSGAFFQQSLTDARVVTNHPGVTAGNGLNSLNIEFWPSNYGQNNDGAPQSPPNANDGLFDFGDGGASLSPGHGSMQIHNFVEGRTLFGYSDWGGNAPGAPVELGIGNQPTGEPDWTFSDSGGLYSVKNLIVVVNAPNAAPPARASCLAHLGAGETADGTYVIDPDGAAGPIAPFNVFCDMTTDGGGYTFLKVSQGLTQDSAAESFCNARGMQLLIPRSQAHLQRAVQIARDAAIGPDASEEYMFILGVYPNFNGANCVGQPMNSGNPSCQWGASDGGSYFLHNSTGFGEPNGDNCTNCSMAYFSYDGAGNLTAFNDQIPGPATQRFICDVGDKQPASGAVCAAFPLTSLPPGFTGGAGQFSGAGYTPLNRLNTLLSDARAFPVHAEVDIVFNDENDIAFVATRTNGAQNASQEFDNVPELRFHNLGGAEQLDLTVPSGFVPFDQEFMPSGTVQAGVRYRAAMDDDGSNVTTTITRADNGDFVAHAITTGASTGNRIGLVATNTTFSNLVICEGAGIRNGSFESGDYGGWTLREIDPVDPTFAIFGIGTEGQVFDNGTTPAFDFESGQTFNTGCFPSGALTIVATDGTRAMFNSQPSGPQRHRMFQTLTVPAGATTLSWDMQYESGEAFGGSQFIAVHIIDPDSDVILATVFLTSPTDPTSVSMSAFSADIAAFAGQTVRVNFEGQVQNNCLPFSIDDIRID